MKILHKLWRLSWFPLGAIILVIQQSFTLICRQFLITNKTVHIVDTRAHAAKGPFCEKISVFVLCVHRCPHQDTVSLGVCSHFGPLIFRSLVTSVAGTAIVCRILAGGCSGVGEISRVQVRIRVKVKIRD